jgi:hypothetical protein
MLPGMSLDNATASAVVQLLRRQCDLITRSQALSSGMSEAALRHRLRPAGPWKIVLPGVYLAHNGFLTVGQRECAAVLYAGRASVITGAAAAWRHGIRLATRETVDVLIPHDDRRQSTGFVRIHRTVRMPERPWIIDGLRWAPPSRAVADAARGLIELDEIRALVADAVQRGRCTIQQLAEELANGPSQGSAALRVVLAEVADGVASVAEADLRTLIKGSGLPEPLYNPRLFAGAEFLGKPDAWWPDAGVAAEVDSREWHLSPAAWHKTMARHSRMSARGIIVLHFPPSRIRSDPAGVVAELKAALQSGSERARLPIRAVI